MAKITFTRDCDYNHNRQVTTAFKAGWSGTVKREIQKWAIEKGYGFEPIGELANGDVLSDGSALFLDANSSPCD